MKSFYFHYNKPKSKSVGETIISVHFDKVCHFVKNIEVNVPTKGKIKSKAPKFVMTGKTDKFTIKNETAIIG